MQAWHSGVHRVCQAVGAATSHGTELPKFSEMSACSFASVETYAYRPPPNVTFSSKTIGDWQHKIETIVWIARVAATLSRDALLSEPLSTRGTRCVVAPESGHM